MARTAFTAATSEEEVPVPVNKRMGSAEGIGGGRGIVAATCDPLLAPQDVKKNSARRDAMGSSSRGPHEVRKRKEGKTHLSAAHLIYDASGRESQVG